MIFYTFNTNFLPVLSVVLSVFICLHDESLVKTLAKTQQSFRYTVDRNEMQAIRNVGYLRETKVCSCSVNCQERNNIIIV